MPLLCIASSPYTVGGAHRSPWVCAPPKAPRHARRSLLAAAEPALLLRCCGSRLHLERRRGRVALREGRLALALHLRLLRLVEQPSRLAPHLRPLGCAARCVQAFSSKGGVAAAFALGKSTTLAFVACHLEAAKNDERRRQYRELVRRMSAAGALQPPLALRPPALLLQHLEQTAEERTFGPRDLLPCPYCRAEHRKGGVAEVPKVRLPCGAHSDLAAWAARLAAEGGTSVACRANLQ